MEKVVEREVERRRAEEVDKQDRQYSPTSVLAVIAAVTGGIVCVASFITMAMRCDLWLN